MRRIVIKMETYVPVSVRARTTRRGAAAMVIAAAAALAAPTAWAAGGASQAPAAGAGSAAISDDARAKFAVGVNLLTDPEGPRYEEAYRSFKAAYASSPSYKILGNLALCAMKLERDDEAIAAYEKYLAEGKDLSRSEVQQITSDLTVLKNSVAHVVVESDPPGAEITDVRVPVRGERVLNAYGTVPQATKLGLHEGTHQVTARLAGYPDQTWDVEVTGGQDLPAHKFVFTKPVAEQAPVSAPTPVAPSAPPPVVTSRPVPVGVWIGVAATGALAVASVVTGVLAMGKHSDFESANGNVTNASDMQNAQSLKDDGQTLNLVNDICVGGAVVAAGITAALYFTRPTVETGGASSRTGVVVVPGVARSGAGLNLLGSF
jgi:hypothetical protein